MQEPKVIFEDEHMLVVDKPPNWVVNDSQTTSKAETIQGWICNNFEFEISKDNLFRSGIVHRLDKDTSGILLIAKTKAVFEELQGLFKERKVKKTYKALLHGLIKEKSGSINASVGRLPWNRERFGVLPGGRDAETDYTVEACYKKGSETYSLVRFMPKTGRTHQIRIHAKHIGHPIVSDSFYAGRKTSRGDRQWCPRLFLHATSIQFAPGFLNGEVLSFESDIPKDLLNALSLLEKI